MNDVLAELSESGGLKEFGRQSYRGYVPLFHPPFEGEPNGIH
jgi:hypothetical protein